MATPPRPLRVRRRWCVVLEQFLKPLSASLGHYARVAPSAWGAGSGRDEGDGLRVWGEGLGAPPALCYAVTDWLLALHGLALPYIRALVYVMVYEYSGKPCLGLQTRARPPARRGEGRHVPGGVGGMSAGLSSPETSQACPCRAMSQTLSLAEVGL